jgi:uncharacterized GH25 family protein
MGATIIVSGRAGAPDIAPLTDSAGWFALDGLSPGKWLLRARGPDNETGEATVPIFNNASTNVTIRVGGSLYRAPISKTGELEGHVLRARSNLPVENATVTVARGPAPAPGIAPMTDSAGWFAIEGLAPGDWVLRALGPNGETGEATVRISSGALANVTIAIEGSMLDDQSSTANRRTPENPVSPLHVGAVEGHVVRARTGLPVENATVMVAQGAGPSPDIAPVTDSAGWFALDSLPPGDWALRASAPDGETGEVTFRVRASEVAQVTIEVSPGGRRSASLSLRVKARAKSSRPDKSKKARTRKRGFRGRG